jgi:hypothetical protein
MILGYRARTSGESRIWAFPLRLVKLCVLERQISAGRFYYEAKRTTSRRRRPKWVKED